MGLMHVATPPKYNFKLIAYCAGQLAADLASQLNDLYSGEKPAEGGQPDQGEVPRGPPRRTGLSSASRGSRARTYSGLLLLARNDTDSLKYVQKVSTWSSRWRRLPSTCSSHRRCSYKEKKQTLAAERGQAAEIPRARTRRPAEGWWMRVRYSATANDAAGAQLAPPAQPLAGLRRGR